MKHYRRNRKKWKLENEMEILSLLTKHSELRYVDLKNELEVSDPTLTSYIKDLESMQRIEAFFKSKDRRERWYRIKPENLRKVEASLGKYEAIRFIENLSDPVYIHKSLSNGKGTVSTFADPGISRKLTEGILTGVIEGLAQYLSSATRFIRKGRVALVVTLGEGKDTGREGAKP